MVALQSSIISSSSIIKNFYYNVNDLSPIMWFASDIGSFSDNKETNFQYWYSNTPNTRLNWNSYYEYEYFTTFYLERYSGQTERTRTINGLKVVDFVGSDEMRTQGYVNTAAGTQGYPGITQPYTIIIQASFDNSQFYINSTDANLQISLNPSTSNIYFNPGGSVSLPNVSSSNVIDTYMIYVNGSSSYVYKNNTYYSLSSLGTTNPAATAGLSFKSLYTNKTISLMEFMYFDREITSTERDNLYYYLTQKWGTSF